MNSQRQIAPPKPVSVYPQPIQQTHPNQNQIKKYIQQPQSQHHQHQQHLPPSQHQYLPQQHKQHHANIAVHQTPSPLDGINMQLQHIERVNRELLGVAEKIRALGIGQNTNIPAVDRLQTEMRQSLNQLIQYIMQFHTDIDSKLKNLGIFITTQLQKKQSHIQTPAIQVPQAHFEEKQDKKYQILAQRIQNLELSLNQTQQNEKKLIQVIENMMERYQINDQPTLIRQNPGLNSQFRKNRIATTSCANIGVSNLETGRSLAKEERQKRVSPMPNNNFGKIEMKNKSIYENLYTIEQSVVNEQKRTQPNYFRLRQIQQQPQQQVYIKRLYSKYPMQQPTQPQSQLKRSLRGQQPQHHVNIHANMTSSKNYENEIINKQERSTASQASSVPQDDKQHRFNFMLGKLNM